MQIRLLSYNIHKCIGGMDRRYRPDRIVETIAHYDPDIVLLQEVDDGVPRSGRDRQVHLLGDELGYRHRAFFPNVEVPQGGVYGNAMLSRFLLTETQNVDLTVGRRKPRSVVHGWYRVRLRRHTRTLHAFNLHLGLSGRERKKQLTWFLDSHPFAGLHHKTPIVVAGDFNDVWGTLGKKLLRPAGFRGLRETLRTFPAWAPMRALDSIYVRGDLQLTKVFRGGTEVARRASDHLPLVADLRIGPRRGP